MSLSIFKSGAPERGALSQLIRNIVLCADPEKVFVLSASFTNAVLENIFLKSPVKEWKACQYDLLILTGETETRSIGDLENIIHSKSREDKMLPLVMPIRVFNEWLLNGNPFACRVFQQGFLCYDRGLVALSTPGPTDPELLQSNKTAFWIHISNARQLLKDAESMILQKQWEQVLPRLKKSFELVFTALITVLMGLQVNAMPPARLFSYGKNLLPGADGLFPLNSETETRLFKLLTDEAVKDLQEAEAVILIRRMQKIWQMSIRVEI